MWGLYQVMPYYCDDYWIGLNWIEGRANWDNYPLFLNWLTTEDSPRFFNFLFPIFLGYIPKWLLNIATGLFWFIAFWLVLRIVGIDLRRPLWTIVILIGLMLCLPWNEDAMLGVVYSTNYVWTLPLLLGSMWCYIHSQKHQKKWILILFFLTGWAQELIAVPLICGCITWLIINRKGRTKWRFALLGSAIFGLCIIIVGSIVARYANVLDNPAALGLSFRMFVYGAVFLNYLAVLGLIMFVAFIIFPHGRKLLKLHRNGIWPMLIGALLPSFIIGSCLFGFGARITWYPQILGLLTLGYLFNLLRPKPIIRSVSITFVIGIVGCGLLFAHLFGSIILTYKQAKMWDVVNKEYLQGHSENVFYDIPTPWSTPWIVYNKAPLSFDGNLIYLWRWKAVFYANEFRMPPVPIELRSINYNIIEKVAGNNPFYLYNNCLIVPESVSELPDYVIIKFNPFIRKSTLLMYTPFTTKEGYSFLLATPSCFDIQMPWNKYRAIDFPQ